MRNLLQEESSISDLTATRVDGFLETVGEESCEAVNKETYSG